MGVDVLPFTSQKRVIFYITMSSRSFQLQEKACNVNFILSSESYVGILLLICRLTVSQSSKSSHNLWKNPGESFTLMSFSASFCVCWPLSRKNRGRREERSQQSPCLPSASRWPLGFAEVEVFEKLQVVRCWEFVMVCVFRPLHAWHERLSSHNPTVANQEAYSSKPMKNTCPFKHFPRCQSQHLVLWVYRS